MRWLCLAWLLLGVVGAAPVLAQEPEPQEMVVEVRPNAAEQIPIGSVDEVLVVDQVGVDVSQPEPDVLEVRANLGGRAVVLLRTGDLYRTLVIRGLRTAPEPDRGPRRSPASPSLLVGGAYGLTGAGPEGVTGRAIHFADWEQRVGRTDLAADVVVEQQPGAVGVSSVYLGARAPTWEAEAGDMGIALLQPVQGVFGTGTLLRGGRFGWHGAGVPVVVGAVGGIGRQLTCCRFVDPEAAVLGAATVGWAPARGFFAEALGGVMRPRQGDQVFPLASLSAGLRGRAGVVQLTGTQSGGGTGLSLHSLTHPRDDVEVIADGAWTSPGFVRPSAQGIGWQGAFYFSTTYRPARAVTLRALVRGEHRQLEGMASPIGRVRMQATAGFPLGSSTQALLAYQRYVPTTPDTFGAGDTLALGLAFHPVEPFRFNLGSNADLPQGRSPTILSYFASAYDLPASPVTLVAAYRNSVRNSEVRWLVRHQGEVGATLESHAVRALFVGTVSTQPQLTTTKVRVGSRARVELRVGRVFAVGVGGTYNQTLRSSQAGWGVYADWRLWPSEFGKGRAGLGFRGRVRGTVFLDEDYDGVRDDDEEGLPGMRILLDSERELTTDEDGAFVLRGLLPGDHLLQVDREAMHSLDGATRQIDVRALGTTGASFALAWGSNLDVVVYDDLDRDEHFTDSDVGVTASRVLLRDARGVVIATEGAHRGLARFEGLAPGTYTVIVDPLGFPEGYAPANGLEKEIVIEEGRSQRVEVKVRAARAVGGIIWSDVDGNRRLSKSDIGIGGAEVYLSNGLVTRTGPDGSFLFRDLSPGGYVVTNELTTDTAVVLIRPTPTEILDLEFLAPRGVLPPEQNVGPAPRRPPTGVAGVVVDAPTTLLPPDVTVQLVATAVLSNGETREVTTRAAWETSTPEVLSVDAQGRVRGREPGQAGVTAEWKGAVADPLTFEVLDTLDEVTVSPVEIRLNPGDKAELSVSVIDRRGRGGEVTPVVEWVVSDPRVARVSDGAVLRALADGSTEVRARIGTKLSEPLAVVVLTASVTAISIENVPARMPVGSSAQLRATGFDTTLQVKDVSAEVTWTSSDPSVLRIDEDGFLTAVSPGTAQLSAAIGSLVTRSRVVAVTNQPPVSLRVIPEAVLLTMSDRKRIRASATFEDGSRGPVTAVVDWQIAGDAAVEVQSDGTLVPVRPGIAEVRATYLGLESPPVTVTVVP